MGGKATRDANATVVVDDGDGGLVVNIGVVLVVVMVTVIGNDNNDGDRWSDGTGTYLV